MARSARGDEAGRIYHLVARGVNRQDIFYDARDRFAFLKGMVRASLGDDLRLIAYVLMTNHVHLVALRGRETLGTAMHGLLGHYASLFNRRHDRCGHLFQNRYRSKLCDSARYLVHLIRYVHRNPVRAGLVGTAAAYPYSSHHWFMRPRPPAWSAAEDAIRDLGGRRQAREFFRGQDDEGDSAVIQEEEERQKAEDERPPTTLPALPTPKPDLGQLAADFETRHALPRGALTSPGRARNVAAVRRLMTVAAVRDLAVRQAVVARFLGVSRTQIHRYLK